MSKYKEIREFRERLEEERKRYEEDIRQKVDATRPKKLPDSEKKEFFEFPMPSNDKVISDKDIDIKTYGIMMINSNWGGKLEGTRYIYEETLNNQINEICDVCNISKRTFKRHLSKLKKCNVNILQPITVKGKLAYLLNYSCDEGKNFVTIDNIALRKLCNAYSENTLRLYIIFKYMCRDVAERHITQECLCEKIGLSYKSRMIITDCVDALVSGGFIKVRVDYKYNTVERNGEDLCYKVPWYYYSLSDDYAINLKN